MPRARGFTLIEVLFALLIIGFVLTTSLAIFYERERRLRSAEELVIAAQAVSIESEQLRQVAFGSLHVGDRAWLTSPAILASLQDASTRVTIENVLYYKRATIEVVWNNGRQRYAHVMHRTDVAGGTVLNPDYDRDGKKGPLRAAAVHAGATREAAVHEAESGFSMLELVVAMAVFAIFLVALLELQQEAISFDRTIRFDQTGSTYPTAVAARLRKDVQEASSYPASFLHFTQTPRMLLLRRSAESPARTIIYEFDATTARRREYSGEDPTSFWEARDTPQFFIDAAEGANGEIGVALKGFDAKNRLIVEGSFFPRAR